MSPHLKYPSWLCVHTTDMLRDSHNLLKWFQRQLEPYRNLVKVIDLTTSWRNGLALCALIHLYRPNLLYDWFCSRFRYTTSHKRTCHSCFQCLVHTADTDKTVLSCLVRGVNWIGDKSRLSAAENFETVLNSLKMLCELSLVLSWPSFQFATWLPIVTSFGNWVKTS